MKRRGLLAAVAAVLVAAAAVSIVHARAGDSRRFAAVSARLAIVDKLNGAEEGEARAPASGARPGKAWALRTRTFPARAAGSFAAAGTPSFGQPTIVGV